MEGNIAYPRNPMDVSKTMNTDSKSEKKTTNQSVQGLICFAA